MKKVLGIFLVLISVVVLSGCNPNTIDLKTTICTLENEDADNNYSLEGTYKVTYSGDVVKKVESTEVITTTDSDILDYFEEFVKESYSVFDGIEHYTYDVSRMTDNVTSTTLIDYEKIDMNKFLKVNEQAEILLKDNKVNYDLVIYTYELMGAICSEE